MKTSTDCERVRLTLMASLDGEDDVRSAPDQQHLSTCVSCRRWLEDMQAMAVRLHGLSYPNARTDLWTAVESRIRQPRLRQGYGEAGEQGGEPVEVEGKMSAAQARALLDSLKGEDNRVQLLNPRDRKIRNIECTRADVVAAGNVGCIVQLAAGTSIPVVHPVELVDWATGGPPPPALGKALPASASQ